VTTPGSGTGSGSDSGFGSRSGTGHVTWRRTVLAAAAGCVTAGCLGTRARSDGRGTDTVPVRGPPTADRDLALPDDTDALSAATVTGGVGSDGIPSIDDPSFVSRDAADQLDGGDPVLGVVRDGVARAYPRRILVHHEIVNDWLAGDPIAVTYCPLTGTAQGFERGRTTFGVSGRLLNSNLVMYDRGTDSRWAQMLATAIDGPHEGDTLAEFPMTWTSWRRWRRAHPETRVLSTETGFVRNYDSDPYGSYNPPDGYYVDHAHLMFDPYREDDRYDIRSKRVVLGARTPEGPLAVAKDRLREAGALTATRNGVRYDAVYDPALDTGYVYRNPDGCDIEPTAGRISVGGRTHQPNDLPIRRVLRYDAMWFAWYGYYPGTTVIV